MELVLPGAGYLVRMLDGRLDVHGDVKELRAQGILEQITRDSALVAQEKEEDAVAAPPGQESTLEAAVGEPVKPKEVRKLIEEEERQSGSVKWSICNTYLRASYALQFCFTSTTMIEWSYLRSYWTWTILVALIILSQLIGVTERWWIMVLLSQL